MQGISSRFRLNDGLVSESEVQRHHEPLGHLHLAPVSLRDAIESAARRAARIQSMRGVHSVVLDGTSGSLSIRYDRSLIDAAELRRAWRGAETGSPVDSDSSGLRWLPVMVMVARALGGARL